MPKLNLRDAKRVKTLLGQPRAIKGPGFSWVKPFSPDDLFRAGEQGYWLDPSDLSTMFQDVNETIPVTGVGQPVGKIYDKSGRNNHFTQATASRRPILQQDETGRYYLQSDGIDDFMSSQVIDPGGVNKSQAWHGVRTDALQNAVSFATGPSVTSGTTTSPSVPGSWGLRLASAGTTADLVSQGTQRVAVQFTVAASTKYAFLLTTDIGAPKLQVNLGTQSTATQGTGNFSVRESYIFAATNASLFFPGRLYQHVVRFGNNLPDETLNLCRQYVADKTGVVL